MGRGEFAGECLTGEPGWFVAAEEDAGRLKFWGYGRVWCVGAKGLGGFDGPKGLEGPNELLPFCWE